MHASITKPLQGVKHGRMTPRARAILYAVTGFSFTQAVLHCDDVALVAIADQVGTPAYVYSLGQLRQRFRALDSAFGDYPHRVHYALKANSTLAVLRVLREEGACADANSIGEIDVAMRVGFPPQDIVFTGVGKSPDELRRAVGLGLKAINVESRGELARVDQLSRDAGRRTPVALRVNPDVDSKGHPHISTGLKRNKFGVAFDTVPAVCREALEWTGVQVVGLHVHIGSQILELEPLRRAVAALVQLAETLRAQGTTLSHLDVGGGLGIAYDGAAEPTYDAYAAMVIAAARPLGLGLVLEPGRTLVAPVGALLTRVVDVKTQADGRLVVVVDASMTELIRPALYGSFHRIEPVAQDAGRAHVVCDIVGPVCESSDSFGTDRVLPSPQVGDLLAIRDAGAYGAVMASNYNRRPLPPEVVVEGSGWRVARRRQSVDDMLAWEN